MLSIANVHLRDIYDSTIEYIALRAPSFPFQLIFHDGQESSAQLTPSQGACLDKDFDTAEQCHCSCPQGTSSSSGLTLSSMRKDVDDTKTELARSRTTEMTRLEERCRMLEKTLRETKDLLKARELEVEKLKKEKCSSRRGSIDQILSTMSTMSTSPTEGPSGSNHVPPPPQKRDGKRDASRDSQEGQKPWAQAMSVRLEQSAHARGLEVFLTKTDLWSGAQVIQAVHDLNSEILQFAASASEFCSFDRQEPRSTSPPPPKTAHAIREIGLRLGPQLARMLSTRDHAQDPILVQLALQGCIAKCIATALSLFCVGFQSKSNVVLSTIYSHIASSEPQPTSARWRALTHRHIHDLQPGLDERATTEIVETICRWSSNVFLIAGCTNPDTVYDDLQSRFGEQVQRVGKAVCKLAHVTKEEIMSTNFDVVAVEQSEAFNAKDMTDAFGDFGPSRGVVLCTTELGLKCSTRKITGKTGLESTVEKRFLLRPKVLLESVADVLDPK